ncbi:toxin-antitoxin system protein [Candidatus Bipolaricaulota bacterium]|nr:toxin-antitoxin system protein [Candidatus Bipolaricaulota bacterium]
MASTTVRIRQETKQMLERIANQTGQKTQEVLDNAIEAYRRRIFLEQANQAYALLKQDTDQWAEELAERKAWDITLSDDLKDA